LDENTADCETLPNKTESIRYVLGLDPTPCHTGWALYDRADGRFDYGVIEPPKETLDDLSRMEFVLEKVFALLPGPATWSQTFVVIEGLAFAGRGSYALQLAGLGYMLRRQFRNTGVPYRDVAPTQAKKFLTGKGNCDKNLILKEVFKRYAIDVDDDNIADAVKLQHDRPCPVGLDGAQQPGAESGSRSAERRTETQEEQKEVEGRIDGRLQAD
jgi:crossover junction endodeoxyribonuclease RuvC